MLETARKIGMPVTLICAEFQKTVADNGGKLTGNLKDYYNTSVDHKGIRAISPAHRMVLNKDTWLYESIRKNIIWVNSHHQEAVAKITDDMIVTAYNPKDKIIEGIQFKNDKGFFVAVQWHPEVPITVWPDRIALKNQVDHSQKIFDKFIQEASSFRTRRFNGDLSIPELI